MKRNVFFKMLVERATNEKGTVETTYFKSNASKCTDKDEYEYYVLASNGSIYDKNDKEVYSLNLGILI